MDNVSRDVEELIWGWDTRRGEEIVVEWEEKKKQKKKGTKKERGAEVSIFNYPPTHTRLPLPTLEAWMWAEFSSLCGPKP